MIACKLVYVHVFIYVLVRLSKRSMRTLLTWTVVLGNRWTKLLSHLYHVYFTKVTTKDSLFWYQSKISSCKGYNYLHFNLSCGFSEVDFQKSCRFIFTSSLYIHEPYKKKSWASFTLTRSFAFQGCLLERMIENWYC